MVSTLAIAELEASILDHEQFAESRWYRGSGSWHYHGPGHSISSHMSDWGYLQIDPDLREICRLLHRHALGTTPSCQGHFFPRGFFLEIWSVLLREAAMIQGGGLLVRDVLDGSPLLFRDEHYTLPWTRANEFVDEASSRQEVGYLGVAAPASRLATLDRMAVACQSAGARCMEPVLRADAWYVLGVEVVGGGPAGQSAIWGRVRQVLADLLASPSDDGD
jgi:hypothetical protein